MVVLQAFVAPFLCIPLRLACADCSTYEFNLLTKLSFLLCSSQISSYERLNRIGEGTYGTVYRAFDRETNEVVALKKVILHNEKQDGFPLTSVREVAVLKRLNHVNCVKLKEMAVARHHDSVYLVFEYCEHDLASLLSHYDRPFSESEVKTLVLQLLGAIEYLHDHYILHRDIKLSNLLYNNRGQLKLADFGLARTFCRPTKRMTNKVVTLWYRAPEVLLGQEDYGPPLDIWAVGCILIELLVYKPTFPGQDELEQIEKIFQVLGAPNDRIWPGVTNLPLIAKHVVDLPRYQQRFQLNNIRRKVPDISDHGLAVINAMLTYDPAKRATVCGSLIYA